MAKNIDEINSVEIDNSSRISGVVPSTVVVGLLGIDDVNGVDNSAPGFSTDYSLDLNGSNQLANFGNLAGTDVQPTQSTMNTNGYTMAAWCYFDALSGGECIINVGNSGTNNYYGPKIFVNGNGAFVFHMMGLNGSSPGAGSNNRNSTRTSNGAISSGQWYHLALVIPSGSMGSTQNRNAWLMYINGTAYSGTYVRSGNANCNLAYSGNTSIGSWTRASNQSFFDGEVNNAAIWKTALSANNIGAIYNSGSPTDISINAGLYTESANLAAWWRFNTGSGTSYTDSSGNNLTGTGVNSPGWSSNVPT